MHFTYENFWSLLSVLFFYGLLISSVNIDINNLQEFFYYPVRNDLRYNLKIFAIRRGFLLCFMIYL